MIAYLLAVLFATLLVPLTGWPDIDNAAVGVILMLGPALVMFLGGLVLYLAKPRPVSPMIWPLVGLALGRAASALISTENAPFAVPFALAALAGPPAFLAAQARRHQVPGALRALGLSLAGLAMGQAAIGMPNALINRVHLAAGIMLCLAAFLPDLRSRNPLVRSGAALVALGVLATGSRGGMLAAVVVAAAYYGRLRLAAPVIALLVPVLLQLRNPQSLAIRWAYWQAAARAWCESPLLGTGPGYLLGDALHAHNLLLGVLAWSGLVGVGLVAWGIWHSRPAWKTLPRWAWAGLAGFLAHSLVEDLTVFPLAMVLVAALLAAATPPAPAQAEQTR